MKIYSVTVSGSEWLTLIVRAADEEEAGRLGLEEAATYHGDPPKSRQADVDELDPSGPPAVLLVDTS